MKAWHEANPRDRRAYKASYDALHKTERAQYQVSVRDRRKIQNAAWYKANRERVLARVKANSESNPERVSTYHAEYYERNVDKVKANVKAYRQANPEKKAALESRRRARKAGNGGSHTVAEWATKCAAFNDCCAYCGQSKPLTRDHVVPLSRGGTDDIANIVPACQSCNSRKNAQTGHEFTNQQRLTPIPC